MLTADEARSKIAVDCRINMAIGLIAIAAILAILLLSCVTPRANFESRYPPISDDEFVERCGLGTNRDIALRVRRIVADKSGVEYARIHPSTSFANDLA